MNNVIKDKKIINMSCKYSQIGAQFILNIFINLYMFWVTMCPSLGDTTVFMRHSVLVILCG